MARLELFFSASRSKRIAKLYNAYERSHCKADHDRLHDRIGMQEHAPRRRSPCDASSKMRTAMVSRTMSGCPA